METDQFLWLFWVTVAMLLLMWAVYHAWIIRPLQLNQQYLDAELEKIKQAMVTKESISNLTADVGRVAGLESRFNEVVKSRVDQSVYDQLIAKIMPYHLQDERVQEKILLLLSRSDIALSQAAADQMSEMVLNDFSALPPEVKAMIAEKVTERFADSFDSYLEDIDFSQYEDDIYAAISNHLRTILEQELAKTDSEYRTQLVAASFNHIVATIEPEY